MRMFNYFNFFPVGQGLFYFGSLAFGKFTFVYDCGTETQGVNISAYIKEVARACGGKKLDFLAISHFHWDHVSGVQELDNVVGFNRVYLPYISSDSRIREFIIGMELFDDTVELDDERIGTFNYLRSLYGRDNRNREPGSGYISCEYSWTFKYFNRFIDERTEQKLSKSINALLKNIVLMMLLRYLKLEK